VGDLMAVGGGRERQGEEGGGFRAGRAEAVRDGGAVGQERAPPVVGAQDKGCLKAVGTQFFRIVIKQSVGREPPFLRLPREAGEGAGEHLVHIGVALEDARGPGADQRRDMRLGPAAAQGAQPRRGEQDVPQVVGADGQDAGVGGELARIARMAWWHRREAGIQAQQGQARLLAERASVLRLGSGPVARRNCLKVHRSPPTAGQCAPNQIRPQPTGGRPGPEPGAVLGCPAER